MIEAGLRGGAIALLLLLVALLLRDERNIASVRFAAWVDSASSSLPGSDFSLQR